MPPSDDNPPNNASDLSGVDARSAGWALSGVTALVLLVGLLVIRSTRSEAEAPDRGESKRSAQVELPVAEPRQRTIVLEADETASDTVRRRDPKVLPATSTVDQRIAPSAQSPATERQANTLYDRL